MAAEGSPWGLSDLLPTSREAEVPAIVEEFYRGAGLRAKFCISDA